MLYKMFPKSFSKSLGIFKTPWNIYRVDIALTRQTESEELRPVLMELELFEPDVFVGPTVDQSVLNYVDAIQLKL